jgi:hypothetical protein
MEKHHWFSHQRSFLWPAVACLLGACGSQGGASSSQAALTAQCAAPAAIPAGAWTCPDPRTLECGQADGETLYVQDGQPSCMGTTLVVADPGPLTVGTHTITVNDAQGGAVCSAQLTIVDTQAPTLTAHTVNLWPPNHKFHEVAVSDCVSAIDACDGSLQGEFIWASSDEPIDDIGDGHFAPDIGLGRDSQHACVRSERQGPRDGRVYKLGVRVTDGSGHVVEGECLVIVDHDQRGVTGKDSGDAYRIQFDPTQLTNCGGSPDKPPGGAGMGGHGGTTGSAGTTGGTGGTTGGTGGTTGGTGGTTEGGTGGDGAHII